MKKTTLIIIILIIAGALFLMFRPKANTPVIDTGTNQDIVDDTEITTINKDIESIDIGDADQEFKDIDTDLKAL